MCKLKLILCEKEKSFMDDEEFNFKEYEQRRIRDDMIMKEVEKANEEGRKSKYSEEQIMCAQMEKGKKAINKIYYESVFPLVNNILFVVYYMLSLITLPLTYRNQDVFNKIVAVLGYLALIGIVAVTKVIDKYIHKKQFVKAQWMCCLEKFSLDTSIFAYILTSIGYMFVIMDRSQFWYIYVSMLLIFALAVYGDIVKPLIKAKK